MDLIKVIKGYLYINRCMFYFAAIFYGIENVQGVTVFVKDELVPLTKYICWHTTA